AGRGRSRGWPYADAASVPHAFPNFYDTVVLESRRPTRSLGGGSMRRCQRSPNNPHGWSLKIPHPPHEGGHRHDGDIVDGRDGGHRRHWPRGHTPRGGTHGSGGLLARGASAVPRGEAVG